MEKKKKETRLCGEITAFLSMIFLLILALIGTTLESARVNVGKSFADRSLQNAMESLFTEYCIPLWEDYHLFFLEGEKTQSEDVDYIRNTLYDYMDYTYNEEDIKIASMDLLDMEIGQIDVKTIVRADEYEGELLLHEILEYEKYQVEEAFLSEQENLLHTTEEMNASRTVIDKKMETEEKLAEANIEVLKFISAVEGLSIGKTGFQWKRNGLLQTEPYFVKQFCNSNASRDAVGIHHDSVWKSLQYSYYNPVMQIEKMEQAAWGLMEEENERGSSDLAKLRKLEEELMKTTKGVLRQAEKACQLLAEIQEKQAVFSQETKELDAVYQSQQKDLSLESQKALEGEIAKLKGFAGEGNEEYHSVIKRILDMEGCLKNNIEILEEVLILERFSISRDREEMECYMEKLDQLKSRLLEYQIRELEFDYSSFTENKKASDPTMGLSDNYESELLQMVVKDTATISKKTSNLEAKNVFSEESNSNEGVIGEQLKKILLYDYIDKNFNCYVGKVSEKDTRLDYEIEYILGEKKSDKENLKEVIKKMVNLRVIWNYLYLLTDSEKSELAYGAAVALVGYSCMEPLIQLTKNLILMTWATEEAIVDVAALLQGKEIPVFKTKASFQMEFDELLSFDKQLVQQKAAAIEETDGTGMNYKAYLKLLLNSTKKGQVLNRIVEIMEDNMKLRYDPNFVFGNCIYGIEVLTKFNMEEKFMRLSGVKKMISASGEGFLIQSQFSYCYD